MMNQTVMEALYSATYVEDFIDAAENLADDIQRHVSRIRELDVKQQGYVRDSELHTQKLLELLDLDETEAVQREKAVVIARLTQALMGAQENQDEHLQIQQQITDLVENKVRQLDLDKKNLDIGKEKERDNGGQPSTSARSGEPKQNDPPERSTIIKRARRARHDVFVPSSLGPSTLAATRFTSCEQKAETTTKKADKKDKESSHSHPTSSTASHNSSSSSSTAQPKTKSTAAHAKSEHAQATSANSNSTPSKSNTGNSVAASTTLASSTLTGSSSTASQPHRERERDRDRDAHGRETRENEKANSSAIVATSAGTGSTQAASSSERRQTHGQDRQDVPTPSTSTATPASAASSTTPSSKSTRNDSKAQQQERTVVEKKKYKKRKSTSKQTDNSPPNYPIDPDEPTYCLCDQVSYGEMIGCDNDLCPIEWFHFSCVTLTTKPKGKWYCPKCRGDRPNVMKPKSIFLKELEKYNREKEEKS